MRRTKKEPIISNKLTNWNDLKCSVNETVPLNTLLKTDENIEVAAKFFNNKFQCAGWNATPELKIALKAHDCPL
jgi:hypothetical protein